MRLLLAVPVLLGVSTTATAVNRTWPGAAPCNTTLQACLDAAGAGDNIAIATNGPIEESISIGKGSRHWLPPSWD